MIAINSWSFNDQLHIFLYDFRLQIVILIYLFVDGVSVIYGRIKDP